MSLVGQGYSVSFGAELTEGTDLFIEWEQGDVDVAGALVDAGRGPETLPFVRHLHSAVVRHVELAVHVVQ